MSLLERAIDLAISGTTDTDSNHPAVPQVWKTGHKSIKQVYKLQSKILDLGGSKDQVTQGTFVCVREDKESSQSSVTTRQSFTSPLLAAKSSVSQKNQMSHQENSPTLKKVEVSEGPPSYPRSQNCTCGLPAGVPVHDSGVLTCSKITSASQYEDQKNSPKIYTNLATHHTDGSLASSPEYQDDGMAPYYAAVECMKSIKRLTQSSPARKIHAIVSAAQYEFMDVWVYVVLKSKLQKLASTIAYLRQYSNPNLAFSEAGYYMASVEFCICEAVALDPTRFYRTVCCTNIGQSKKVKVSVIKVKPENTSLAQIEMLEQVFLCPENENGLSCTRTNYGIAMDTQCGSRQRPVHSHPST
ncbi:hypothetical protein OS493_015179 [Desmophyllum pertusum]|uniref:VPS9 domain-containing protein n=1 Tax=Desmophyllum pertusum TaxID=174260 RepID=A0A9W9ZQF6_9CNID|nr:hypothetical protein OS493_015179 [Desmophyllum pertusum]